MLCKKILIYLIIDIVFKDLHTQTVKFPNEYCECIKNIDNESNHLFEFLEVQKYTDELNHIVRNQLV